MIYIAAEKNFENRIKVWFQSVGIYPAGFPSHKMTVPQVGWYIKYWAGSQFTKSGIPDILVCVNGYFVAVEVKGPNGTASDLQIKNIKMINASNGFAFVLYPSAFDEFKTFINGLIHDIFSRDSIPMVWK